MEADLDASLPGIACRGSNDATPKPCRIPPVSDVDVGDRGNGRGEPRPADDARPERDGEEPGGRYCTQTVVQV